MRGLVPGPGRVPVLVQEPVPAAAPALTRVVDRTADQDRRVVPALPLAEDPTVGAVSEARGRILSCYRLE